MKYIHLDFNLIRLDKYTKDIGAMEKEMVLENYCTKTDHTLSAFGKKTKLLNMEE